MKRITLIVIPIIGLLVMLLFPSGIFKPSPAKEDKVIEAAKNFLNVLSEKQQSQTSYSFDDKERYNWDYVPLEHREGITLNEMDDRQKEAALALLRASVSEQAYKKLTGIFELENVLKVLENHPPENNYRDPGKYFFTVFGKPAEGEPWGWRLEGHHVSWNFSAMSNQLVSSTPAFIGANPAKVPSGPKAGWRVLNLEEDLARDLVKSLDDQHLEQAVIEEVAYPEILTGKERKAIATEQAGLPYNAMSSQQQQKMKQLLDVYLNNFEQNVAEDLKSRIEQAGWEKIYFAWAGGTEQGDKHYYRIQSPVFIVEYDNTQNDGNHIHTVFRDLANDFGEDVLKKHYEEAHH